MSWKKIEKRSKTSQTGLLGKGDLWCSRIRRRKWKLKSSILTKSYAGRRSPGFRQPAANYGWLVITLTSLRKTLSQSRKKRRKTSMKSFETTRTLVNISKESILELIPNTHPKNSRARKAWINRKMIKNRKRPKKKSIQIDSRATKKSSTTSTNKKWSWKWKIGTWRSSTCGPPPPPYSTKRYTDGQWR